MVTWCGIGMSNRYPLLRGVHITTAPIEALREGGPWEFGEQAHCLHCRGYAPTEGQNARVVLITRHGIYFRGIVRCRCGNDRFCLPILDEGAETPQPWTDFVPPDPTDPGGGSPVLMTAGAA